MQTQMHTSHSEFIFKTAKMFNFQDTFQDNLQLLVAVLSNYVNKCSIKRTAFCFTDHRLHHSVREPCWCRLHQRGSRTKSCRRWSVKQKAARFKLHNQQGSQSFSLYHLSFKPTGIQCVALNTTS